MDMKYVKVQIVGWLMRVGHSVDHERLQVLVLAGIKMTAFWDFMPCSLV
jgi:hypothetical protein